jgi:LacI family transcriptional regulator
VSFVLNNVPGLRIRAETRQRVLQVASQLDYHPDAIARLLTTGQSMLLGLVLNTDAQALCAEPGEPEALRGLSQAARARGYQVLYLPASPEHPAGRYRVLAHERRLDGFVVAGPGLDADGLAPLLDTGLPVVAMGRHPAVDIPYVAVDHLGAAQAATEHLLNLGHRQIALLTAPPAVCPISSECMAGYRKALLGAGISYDERLVLFADPNPERQQQVAESLMGRNPPQAVFATSDALALSVIQAVGARGGRLPKDVAVVGYGDLPLARFLSPPLTTMHLPDHALGQAAGELLTHLLAKEPVGPRGRLLPAQLIVRESSGAHQSAAQTD